MGSRAFVIFEEGGAISPAVHLRWSGKPEEVYPFLDELDRREVPADVARAPARFIAIVSEFLDQGRYTGLSLGVMNGPDAITADALQAFSHGTGGIYVVSRDSGKRKVRRFVPGKKLTELSQKSTEKERREAYKHEHSTGGKPIKGIFTKSVE